MPRISYEDSSLKLQAKYLDDGTIPPIPDRMPQYDDEGEPGVSFFRTYVGDGDDLSNLSLPRTFFGNSEIRDVGFSNTDFTESNLCWNDFIDVDFSGAMLTRSDLRASLYERVKFVYADLSHADLRMASFVDCDFKDASMAGAVLTQEQGRQLVLSDIQRSQIVWADEDGPEPGGG